MAIVAILLSSSVMINSVAFGPLSPGEPSLYAVALLVDDSPPSIRILTPESGQVITNLTVHVSWEVYDLGSGINHTFLRLDSGNWLNVDGRTSFDAHLLQGGQHNFTIAVLDLAGNQVRQLVDFIIHIAPDAPQSVNATAGASGIGISWAAPFDGGSPILSYKLFRGLAPGEYGSTPLATPSVAVYFDSEIVNGSKYFYAVRASNTQGDGPASTEVNATLATGPRPPDAPTELTAKLGMGFVSLSWSPPPDQGGGAIAAYKVYRTNVPGGNPSIPLVTLNNAQRYFIDASLVSGEYYYKVSAVNFAEGPRSNESSAFVDGIQPGSPGTIASLSLIEQRSAIRLSWDAPPEGASPIVGYLIYRSAAPYDPVYLNNTTSPSYEDRDVVPGETLHYWIVAENGQGQGPLSAMMTGTVLGSEAVFGNETLLLIALMALVVVILAVIVLMRRRK